MSGPIRIDDLARMFRRASSVTVRNVLLVIATNIGEEAAQLAASKLGTYQSEVGPFNAWETLKDSTIERKGGVHNPLIREGDLRDSITHEIKDADNKFEVHLGSTEDSAGYQEYGAPNANTPPRPYMGPALLETAEAQAEEIGVAMASAVLDENMYTHVDVRRRPGAGLVNTILAARRTLRK